MSALPSDALPAEHNTTIRTAWQASCVALLQCLALATLGEWLVWTFSGLREPGDGVIWSFLAGQAVLIGSGGWLWYRIALLRSRSLRVDASGLHYVEGVLPWKKTRLSCTWAEFDSVAATSGVLTGLIGAGVLRIKRRATDPSIVMRNVSRPDELARLIESVARR